MCNNEYWIKKLDAEIKYEVNSFKNRLLKEFMIENNDFISIKNVTMTIELGESLRKQIERMLHKVLVAK